MDKKFTTLLVALLFGLIMAGAAYADNGPATIVLEGGKKGKVTFNHHKHQENIKCAECHHGPGHSEYAEGMKVEKCSDCHNKENAEMPKKLQKTMNAFHKNCKDCHKKEGHGPTKCGDCHKK
jgi:hypothetical protein